MLVNEGTKSFRVKRALFPDGTEKINTHEECTHCEAPLFLAFRDSDFHPVLACASCGRLYLSKETTKILARAREKLEKNGNEPLFSTKPNGRQNAVSQAKNEPESSLWWGATPFSRRPSTHKIRTLVNRDNMRSSTELKPGWQAASQLLSSQLTGMNSSRNGIVPPESEKEHTKFYELKFDIDMAETRIRILDALLIVNEVFPNQCWVSQQNHTLTFRATSAVKKELVKTILQIVGHLCGFKLTFMQEPDYEALRTNPEYAQHLLTILMRLGQKWETKLPVSIDASTSYGDLTELWESLGRPARSVHRTS